MPSACWRSFPLTWTTSSSHAREVRRSILLSGSAGTSPVVEVWSPSTGTFDVDTKLPEYQRRGDLEIWRIHPYDRILTAWRRQADGSYTESIYREGTIQPVALPGVVIDLDTLFD